MHVQVPQKRSVKVMGDENPSDEHITMLMGMGFSDIEFIRKALSMAKNDLNEAVAILTGEDSRGNSHKHLKYQQQGA